MTYEDREHIKMLSCCADALGDAAVHLEKAAEEDLDNYMQNVAPDGVDEHTAMLAKLRDETKAAEGNLPTEPAATGKWQ